MKNIVLLKGLLTNLIPLKRECLTCQGRKIRSTRKERKRPKRLSKRVLNLLFLRKMCRSLAFSSLHTLGLVMWFSTGTRSLQTVNFQRKWSSQVYILMRCFRHHFRLHDTVIIGGHGPKQVIQHHGANEYQFKIDDLKTVLEGRDPGMVHWYVIFEQSWKRSFSRIISIPLSAETWKIFTNMLRKFFFCLCNVLGENNMAITIGHLLHTNLNC